MDQEKNKIFKEVKSKIKDKGKVQHIKPIAYLKGLTKKEIFVYIQILHKFIRKQGRKLKKYKNKLKLNKSSEKKQNTKSEDAEIEKPNNFIDEIIEAAETAQNENGFIYEPTSGLYYDQKTGYYYNAEYGLYYDGNSGCYYNYNADKNEFEFHSQVQAPEKEKDQVHENFNNLLNKFTQLNINQMRENAIDHSRLKRSLKRKRVFPKDVYIDLEDGEISESSVEYDDYLSDVVLDDDEDTNSSKFEDIAKKYPPSLRIVVQETNLSKIKTGSLSIITFKGGTLGREGDHDVIIPDVNVSKYHLRFTYDEGNSVYKCVDLGSRNGTILNGSRMSNAKQESEPLDVPHGSVIQISQTKLLCHIHSGNSTCGHCEPGLIIDQKSTEKVTTISHKEQLKKLQKRYGLDNQAYVAEKHKVDPNYTDRAAVRRDNIGSTNDCEKTQTASVETAISSDNKGFKMLSKLGWNKGEALGKKADGLVEPISLSSNAGTTGLGCDAVTIESNKNKNHKTDKKAAKWKKAQDRYKKLPQPNIFDESDEST